MTATGTRAPLHDERLPAEPAHAHARPREHWRGPLGQAKAHDIAGFMEATNDGSAQRTKKKTQ